MKQTKTIQHTYKKCEDIYLNWSDLSGEITDNLIQFENKNGGWNKNTKIGQ